MNGEHVAPSEAEPGSATAPSEAVPAVVAAPERRSALHHYHLTHGATLVNEAGWARPTSYGDEGRELRLLRERVGLVDISPLGKIELLGVDGGEWLAQLCPGFAAPAQGQVVPCRPLGEATPHGTALCARTASDRLLLFTRPAYTAPTLEALRATRRPEGAVAVDVTSVYCGINVVGPRARDLLLKLTALDLRARSLAHLACAETTVARVHTLVLRQDLGGVLAFELYCPRDYGEFLWHELLRSGREYGIGPAGIVARRRLRFGGGAD